MGQLIEINEGEVVVRFKEPVAGKVTLEELGIKSEDLAFEGGFLRLVFDMEGIGEHHYFQVPTIEVAYKENMAETHWQCEFNGETILDKTDNHGSSTIILLNRKKLADLEHHHENTLILHAEFPEGVHILADKSTINFFK
ncbi:MAG: hypothetical protein ACWA41_08075 [Putridiphycobacter sp.]